MSRKVLVIDDEPDIILTVRLTLELEGYEVIAAATGEEGLELVRDERPDVVLLDLRLPGLDGFAVLERLPAAELNVPIIVISAHAAGATIRRAFDMGCRDFITKPFSPDELVTKIDAAMSDGVVS